ncbi:MAG: glycosyltransferase family 39 protein [Methanococci archaeon]|nr:glycosyltransferase family 39 protein [Methanococci archaeon]
MKTTYIILLAIIGIYLISHFYLNDYINDGAFYDGACYYVDAKHVAEGLLPYKDFVLVHPLPYILYLAFLIKFFNLSFLDTIHLSYILGLIGLIYMYKIGKLLKNEYFGILLAFIYTIDPIFITYSKVPLMENLMVPITIIGIYYLLKYIKSSNKKSLYISLFTIGIAFSMKMTLFPFVIGLLIFIILINQKNLLDKLHLNYIKDIPKIFLITLAIYLLILYAIENLNLITKYNVFIPFLTKIYIDMSNFPLAFLFVYIFVIISIIKILKTFKLGNINIKFILSIILMVFLPKIIEFAFGFLIGGYDYIQQCYISNSGRPGMIPFVSFYHLYKSTMSFYYVGRFILCGWGILILTLLFSLIIKLISNQKTDKLGKKLFLLFVCVLFTYNIFPTLHATVRFIYPTYIIMLISFLYWIWDALKSIKPLQRNIIIFSFLTLSLLNFSIAMIDAPKYGFYYDDGVMHYEDDKYLMNNLYNYLKSNNELSKTIFSTSPVPVAYLNLNAYPKYIDTFAPVVIEKNASEIINDLKNDKVNYFLLTPWGFEFDYDKNNLGKFAFNHTLKYEVGDRTEQYLLFDLNSTNKNNFSFYISKGNLIITDFNNTYLTIKLNATYYELIYHNNNSYILKYNLTDGSQSIANIKTAKNLLIYEGNKPIIIPLNNKIVIINGNITYIDKKDIPLKNVSSIVIFSNDKINITGEINGLINNSKLVIEKPEIEIKLG